jgi:hypothetical protein
LSGGVFLPLSDEEERKEGRKEGRKCEGCMDTLEEGNISSGIVPARDPRSLQKKKN